MDTQISAYVSESTKRELERFADAHGIKKGHLIEEALLHHLLALRELPEDLVVPPRLVVTKKSFDAAVARVKKPRRATRAMRDLMAGRPGDEP